MNEKSKVPSSPTAIQSKDEFPQNKASKSGLVNWLKDIINNKPDTSLRDAIEEYIEDPVNSDIDSISLQEKLLLANILALRDLQVVEAMVPRADIFALEENINEEDLLKLLAEKQFSRIPVYRETLDNILGTVHLKDIIACIAHKKPVQIKNLVTDIPIFSPAMPIIDLLIKMQEHRRHMAMVVDEYGGIDGLVTIGDVIEMIVGQIDDEHDTEKQPEVQTQDDGSLIADARVNTQEFENDFGDLLTEDEREETDTLGGLVFLLAGRVPARGEVIAHSSGMTFDILDADPRRIKSIRIRNIPDQPPHAT